jgi:hypothetical protein
VKNGDLLHEKILDEDTRTVIAIMLKTAFSVTIRKDFSKISKKY